MATGVIPAQANKILDYVLAGTAFTLPVLPLMVQLHTASPGAAGTSAVAADLTRHAVTAATPSAGGTRSNTVAIPWSAGEVTTTETYTYFSIWDSAGTPVCWFTGQFSVPVGVTAGATFSIAIGALVFTMPVAS